jgi:predicted amidophosphoribosyltransferase
MFDTQPRLAREFKTIAAMLRIYCRDQHATRESLCADCQSLLDYARGRLEKCPFQETKPTCANCTVHCYKPGQRARVREVMRYAGPRMLLCHPLLAIRHLRDGRRKAPALARRRV